MLILVPFLDQIWCFGAELVTFCNAFNHYCFMFNPIHQHYHSFIDRLKLQFELYEYGIIRIGIELEDITQYMLNTIYTVLLAEHLNCSDLISPSLSLSLGCTSSVLAWLAGIPRRLHWIWKRITECKVAFSFSTFILSRDWHPFWSPC